MPGLILLALALFLLSERQVAALRGLALSAASPVLGLCVRHPNVAGSHLVPVASDVVKSAGQGARDAEGLAEECDRLKAEVVRLAAENKMLRNALPGGGPATQPSAVVSANVISRKTVWQEELYGLDRGESQGVRKDAAVLYRGVAVGRIVAVGPSASSMALVTHRGMTVTARLAEQRNEGMLQGGSDENGEPRCKMLVVTRDLSVHPGEHVVTAGLDGAFPPGLWLGDVVSARKMTDAQWEVSVRPACKENCIESVQILTGAPPEVPWPSGPAKGRSAQTQKGKK